MEIGQDNRRDKRVRNDRVGHHLVGKECGDSAETSKKHFTRCTLEAGAPPGQVWARKTVCHSVVAEFLGSRVKARYPFIRAHPKQTALVFEDAAHNISTHAVALAVNRKCSCSGIKFVQPVLSANPHASCAIEIDGDYAVVAETVRVVGLVAVDCELAGVWIESVQP